MCDTTNNLILNLNLQPSTRYQGSKRKLIPWIYDQIENLNFETCLDAFGGTASVSYLFKKMKKQVTYNDNLKFNYLIGKAIIENNNVTLTKEDIRNLKNNSCHSFVKDTFKDIYYFNNENKWIDNILGNLLIMNHYPEKLLEYKKALIYYSLFQSCLIKRPFNLFHRKNLNLRINNVNRNFGNKSSWDKSFINHFNHFVKETNSLVFDSGKVCYSQNKSAFDIEGEFDLVYLDPPYFAKNYKNETSNYLKCYHFLEGLSKYYEWEELIDFDTINLRFKKSENEDEFIENNIYDKFEELLFKFRKSIIVFSYKKGGKPSIDSLIKLMKKFKQRVYTKSIHYSYALNHQNGDKKRNREVLIIGI